MLLPGLMCDRAVWAAQIEALAPLAACQVMAYGALDSLAAMAEHVIEHAPPGRFALAGHSMGGRVAFEVLRRVPERIERLALLDTATHPLPDGEAGATEKAGRLRLLEIARTQGMQAMAREWATGMVHPAHRGEPVFEAIVDMIARATPEIFAAQIRALLARPDAAPLLATIRCPTLVLCGREDGWSPPARHEFMHQRIAGSQLVVIERCGHMSTMERPVAVSAALADWLQAPGTA